MTEWKTYIQVNIYGRTLQDLYNKGIHLESVLNGMGCQNHSVAEMPMWIEEEQMLTDEPVISDWNDQGIEIDAEEVARNFAQMIVDPIPRCSTPIPMEDGDFGSEGSLNLTGVVSHINSDDDNEGENMLDVSGLPPNFSSDEETPKQESFLIIRSTTPDPNDSLFQSGPLVIRPKVSDNNNNDNWSEKSSDESSDSMKTNGKTEIKEEESDYDDDDCEVEVELKPNTSQNFFHYEDGNYTPHYTKRCKSRMHHVKEDTSFESPFEDSWKQDPPSFSRIPSKSIMKNHGDDQRGGFQKKKVSFKVNDQVYKINCNFEGCEKVFLWRTKQGKLRLINHALSHQTERCIGCRNCDFKGRSVSQMRYHYKKKHATSKIDGMSKISFKYIDIESIWEKCYGKDHEIVGKVFNGSSRRYYQDDDQMDDDEEEEEEDEEQNVPKIYADSEPSTSTAH
ncbi:Protein CBG27313 [Caenorhabditis briggsae]|uniref:Protein CBG27313 n=2 Tax=Caenorhabditis briggsae TaxID=6238 RepID=B6IIQ2_CAEBR|nr:Protein CBG27313 [Caenorhabditis briggsae]ULU13204.1 hypothetical protein L3Y34_016007 [Caenorhabditis briggsae]CAR99782.1 Protein CBG27313 [Caenorhabditis briggsae]